jgi:hypothetical protein
MSSTGRRLLLVFLLVIVGMFGAPGVTSAVATPRLAPALARLFPEGLPNGARQVSTGRIVLAGGRVIVDAPSAATDGVCVTGYVCFWRDAQYLSTRVMTNVCDTTGDALCDWQNLAPIGFNDVMSSWKNRMTVDAKWSFNAGGGGTQLCMNAGSQNPQLSGANNDQASAFKIFTSASAC